MSPAIAYAVPLVFIAVMGIAIFVAMRRPPVTQPDVADAGKSQFLPSQTPAPPVEAPTVERSTVAAGPQTERKPPLVGSPAMTNTAKRRQPQPPTGGSTDEALGEQRPVTTISNASNASIPANRDDVIAKNSVPIREMLAQLGITAEFTDGWVVRRIVANSQAERSGLKPGDVLTALGDTALNNSTEFKGQFSASTIRIRRDGQDLQLVLR